MLQPQGCGGGGDGGDGGHINGLEQKVSIDGGSSAGSAGSLRSRRRRRRRSRERGGGGSSPRETPIKEKQFPPPITDFDQSYFQYYSNLGIHEEMIKDRIRTETYRDAIFEHQDRISGKVVVDVGCGTGILSIFCAQAGARRVYAVDASNIAAQAEKVVEANKLSGTILVMHGRVEDVEIAEKVDVIVSEWMGYMLFYESMLESVVTARERWLKPGGLILPSHATLYMAPISHPDRYSASVDFWQDVYGIDMSVLMPYAKQCAFEEPSVESLSGENVLAWPHVVIKHVDCSTISIHELQSISASFKVTSMMRAPFNGFGFWFHAAFTAPSTQVASIDALPAQVSDNQIVLHSNSKRHADLVLSTAPVDPPTHWQQTVIYLYNPIEVEEGQVIEGSVVLTQSRDNHRFMNIHLEYTCGGHSFVKEVVMR